MPFAKKSSLTLNVSLEGIDKASSSDAIFEAFSKIVTQCYVAPKLTLFKGPLTADDGLHYKRTLDNLISYLKAQCAAQKLDVAQVRIIVFCILEHYEENKLGLPAQALLNDKKAFIAKCVTEFSGDIAKQLNKVAEELIVCACAVLGYIVGASLGAGVGALVGMLGGPFGIIPGMIGGAFIGIGLGAVAGNRFGFHYCDRKAKQVLQAVRHFDNESPEGNALESNVPESEREPVFLSP